MSCPICDKPTDKTYRPFCSRRCADVDLGRWLSEDYRLPAEEEADDPTESPERPAPPLN
ncbi:DNA gyrase inhibitor YacG [Oceanibium sediminis]|uniref:DNA gyrase inhibitor YacG n=1 Tax=Oceanibium sediminis TaxID=2026339 RepID=UPI000DD45FB8|nr:DNA gyrase inhibitor YacG [Oceanibium sediminis]